MGALTSPERAVVLSVLSRELSVGKEITREARALVVHSVNEALRTAGHSAVYTHAQLKKSISNRQYRRRKARAAVFEELPPREVLLCILPSMALDADVARLLRDKK